MSQDAFKPGKGNSAYETLRKKGKVHRSASASPSSESQAWKNGKKWIRERF